MRLFRGDTVRVDQVGADERTTHAHPLLDQIDRYAVQLELVATAKIPTQIEGTAIAKQHPGLVDYCPDCRHARAIPVDRDSAYPKKRGVSMQLRRILFFRANDQVDHCIEQ
jgi:hypothetical protein